MHEDYSINYRNFQLLCERQIDAGVSALVVCGTTGEASTLSDDEQYRLIRLAAEVSAGRVPVVAGAGSNCTEHAARLAANAKTAGADAVLSITPYYNKTTQNGLVGHFSAVCAAASLPIIIYNVPSRTGMSITPDTYLKLSMLPGVCAVKEASGSIGEIADSMARTAGLLDFYSGNDDMTVPCLSLGAKGVISVLSNLFPEAVRDMCDSFFAGKTKGAAKKQLELLTIIRRLFCETNPIPVKYAMNHLGLSVGPCRLPLCELSYDARMPLELELGRLVGCGGKV